MGILKYTISFADTHNTAVNHTSSCAVCPTYTPLLMRHTCPILCVHLHTEASKKMLQYLAQCSGHKGEVDRVKDRLLQSNPVLEVSWLTVVTD